jgi:hypothetical protein
MIRKITISLSLLLAAAAVVQAQNTTTLLVVVPAEAALTVTTGTTSLATTGTNFGTPFTGNTNFSFQIRTTRTGGSGAITAKVTADFGGSGGPSVGTPPSSGDALTYTCTVNSPGTACTGSQTASTTASTPVATFGAGANTARAGNTGSVTWSLTDDPMYATGTYSATVTFTVSAT